MTAGVPPLRPLGEEIRTSNVSVFLMKTDVVELSATQFRGSTAERPKTQTKHGEHLKHSKATATPTATARTVQSSAVTNVFTIIAAVQYVFIFIVIFIAMVVGCKWAQQQ